MGAIPIHQRKKGQYEKGLKSEELFIKEYMAQNYNGTLAYMAVHPTCSVKTAGTEACKILKNPKIMARIDQLIHERMEHLDVKADKIVSQLRDMVFFDDRQLYDDNGDFKGIQNLNYTQQAAIQSVENIVDKNGKTKQKVTLVSKTKFYELLMKTQGMLVDKQEVTTPKGVQVYLPENGRG